MFTMKFSILLTSIFATTSALMHPRHGYPPHKFHKEHVQKRQVYHDSDIQQVLGLHTNIVIPIQWSDTNITLPSIADYMKLFTELNLIYQTNSFGKFALNITILDWQRVDYTSVYASNGISGLNSVRLDNIMIELLDNLNIDTSLYDTVTFLHSGYSAEWGDVDIYGNDINDRIWSHENTFMNGYGYWDNFVIASGLWDIQGNEIAHVGMLAHETLHMFGLPDLYDTRADYYDVGVGLGCFSLMSDSWGCDESQNPPMLDPYLRMKLGWINPIELSTSGTFPISPSQTNNVVYKITKNYPIGEYLLIEYREPIGIEKNLIGSGILVYHIDEKTLTLDSQSVPPSNSICRFSPTICDSWPKKHYRVSLLQADGLYELESTDTYGNEGDFWASGMVLNSVSLPNINTYQNGVVNNVHLSIYMGDKNFTLIWTEPVAAVQSKPTPTVKPTLVKPTLVVTPTPIIKPTLVVKPTSRI